MQTLSTAILARASFTERTNYAQPTLRVKAALTFKGFFHLQRAFLDRLGFLEAKGAFVHQFSGSCCKELGIKESLSVDLQHEQPVPCSTYRKYCPYCSPFRSEKH